MTTPTTKALLMSRLGAGAAGGVVGGVAFGLLMHMMGMMPMVAMLAGSASLLVGWAVHLAISAAIGAAFGVVVPAVPVRRAILMGAGYGAVWWVLGALLLMPARLGMPVFTLNATAWQSLMGHLIYGALLGAGYALVLLRLRTRGTVGTGR